MAGEVHQFQGECHCGAIGFTFTTSREPDHWKVRECQCTFCRLHGARTTSDPNGAVVFLIQDGTRLVHYRFGSRSADFLICHGCGVYLAAVLTTHNEQFATLNVNVIRDVTNLVNAVPVSYQGESIEQKIARRRARWTPVRGVV